MNNTRKYISYVLIALAIALVVITGLSLFYNISNIWWIKSLNFPRIQFFLANLLILILLLVVYKTKHSLKTILAVLLTAAIGIQAYYIIPYTFLSPNKVKEIEAENVTKENALSIVVSNVYMKNRNDEALLKILNDTDADILLIMETDSWWQNALSSLKQKYPYTVEQPNEKTYGMLLYSKYKLSNTQILTLSNPNVPSIHTEVELPNGKKIDFHGMHPVPPVPSKHPDNVGEKENELDKLADMLEGDNSPKIIAGDFNDVAWSHTSKLFQKKSRLLDVRIGRWFYNTFDAKSNFMRWPLDHVYVTPDFKLAQIKTLPFFGSDHFPLYVHLVL